jgi:adenine-specific DNA-methyltransferase
MSDSDDGVREPPFVSFRLAAPPAYLPMIAASADDEKRRRLVRAIRETAAGRPAREIAWATALRIARARSLPPSRETPADSYDLERTLPAFAPFDADVDLVADVYEAGLSAAARRGAGVHYTPREVVAFLCSRAGDLGDLVDLACGAGRFLLEAVRRRGADPGCDAVSRVRGVEIDPVAAELAVESLALAAHGGDIEGARRFFRTRVVVGDSLRMEHAAADSVVGNPPFHAATGRVDLQRFARDRFPAVFSGRNDIAHFFSALAVEVLRPGGRLALVLPSYAFDNTFAAPFRALLDRMLGDAEVYDLGAAPFCASVHTVLYIATRGAPRGPRRHFIAGDVGWRDLGADLLRLASGEPSRVFAERAAEPAWLATIDHTPRLEDLARVEKGPETGRNDIFVMARERAKELGIEPEVCRCLIKGRHIAPFLVTPSNEALLYLDGRSDIERFPRALAYLVAHRGELLRRADCRDGRYPWWRLHRPRSTALANAPAKLVVPYRAAAPMFAVDETFALNDGGDVRFLIPNEGVDPYFLCGVLNSRVVRTWFEHRGKRKGGLFEFFQEPLWRVPVPSPQGDEAREIALAARALSRSGASDAAMLARLDSWVLRAYGLPEAR